MNKRGPQRLKFNFNHLPTVKACYSSMYKNCLYFDKDEIGFFEVGDRYVIEVTYNEPSFVVVVIKDKNWDNPLQKFTSFDIEVVYKITKRLVEAYSDYVVKE